MIDGKVAAYREGDTVWKKGKQVMLFRNLDGFGFSQSLILDETIEWVKLKYEGLVYTVNRSTFLSEGTMYTNPQPPHDAQVILPRKFWLKTDPNQPSLL